MFEVISFDGAVLWVYTPFMLALGEEIPLTIEGVGQTTAWVTGHPRSGDRQLTELTLSSPAPAAVTAPAS